MKNQTLKLYGLTVDEINEQLKSINLDKTSV